MPNDPDSTPSLNHHQSIDCERIQSTFSQIEDLMRVRSALQLATPWASSLLWDWVSEVSATIIWRVLVDLSILSYTQLTQAH